MNVISRAVENVSRFVENPFHARDVLLATSLGTAAVGGTMEIVSQLPVDKVIGAEFIAMSGILAAAAYKQHQEGKREIR